MNGLDATIDRRDLRPRLEAQRRRTAARAARCAPAPRLTPPATAPRPKRSRAMLTLTIAIVAGSLMLIAGYMSMSGLRSTAWEKEHPTASQPVEPQPGPAPVEAQPAPAAAPAPAPVEPTGGYITAP